MPSVYVVSVCAGEEPGELLGYAHYLRIVELQLSRDIEHTFGATTTACVVVVVVIIIVVVVGSAGWRNSSHATTAHAHLYTN